MYLGVSGRYETYEKKNDSGKDYDTLNSISLGLLYKLEKVSLGLFLQDMNRAARTTFDTTYKYVFNVRPGISYKFDEKTLVSLEIYDAAGNTKQYNPDVSHDLRFGVERWINERMALRAGGYHLNSSSDTLRAITLGFGFKPRNIITRAKDLTLDYTVIYWTDPLAGTNHYTCQMGLKFGF